MVRWVVEKPTITLQDLTEKMLHVHGKRVSRQTISRYLHGRLLTMKKIRPVCEMANNAVNKAKRRKFAIEALRHRSEGKTLVWIDETNFNLFCSRSFGRSARGQRAVKTFASSRGPNLHIVGAMMETGLVAYDVLRGSFTGRRCLEWFKNLVVEICGDHPERSVINISCFYVCWISDFLCGVS